MITEEQLQNATGVIATTQNVLVIFAADPSIDELATATSIFLGLEKQGKHVLLLSPEFEMEKFKNFAGSNRVTSKLGNKNLNIIFDYNPEAIDKVSYHINEEANKFYLVVQPQKGQQPLDIKSVSFDYAGAEADLIILVGVSELEELEQLYFGYEQLFQDSALINIASFESSVANINLDTSGTSSISENVVDLLESLGIELDADIATNLLAGIEDRTDSFHSLSASPNTFEKAAKLLKIGARRIHRVQIEKTNIKLSSKKNNQQLIEVMKSRANLSLKNGENSAKKSEVKRIKLDRKSVVTKKDESSNLKQPGELSYQPSGFGPGGNG